MAQNQIQNMDLNNQDLFQLSRNAYKSKMLFSDYLSKEGIETSGN
tara:strand:+ start:470 stop:604 length:135 start_codon:yes stop_codon:yes gene_type:complete